MQKMRWENGTLYFNDGAGWKVYTLHPLYKSVGDYGMPNGSKGYKLSQYLLNIGYTYDRATI